MLDSSQKQNEINDIREQLRRMSPEQRELFTKFKDVATAKTPQEKQIAFVNFLGFLKSKKGMEAQGSQPHGDSLSVTETLTGGLNV